MYEMYGITPPSNALVCSRTTPWFSSEKHVGIPSQSILAINANGLLKHMEIYGHDFDIYFFINFHVYNLYEAYRISLARLVQLREEGYVKTYKLQGNGQSVLLLDNNFCECLVKLTRKQYIEASPTARIKEELKGMQTNARDD